MRVTRSAGARAAAVVLFALAFSGEAFARASGGAAREAEARLQELAKSATLAQQAATAEADGYYRTAQRLYEAAEYDKALEMTEKALELYPDHPEAQELASFIRSMLGYRTDWVRANLESFAEEKRVKIQESLMELQWALTRGRAFKRDAMTLAQGDAERARDVRLSRQIGELEGAMEQFRRALEIIKWMPYQVNLENEEREAQAQIAECGKLHNDLSESLRSDRRRVAVQRAQEHQGREVSYLAERLKKLLDLAQDQYARYRLEECEEICSRILDIDPGNQQARALLHDSRRRRHQLRAEEIYEATRHETRSSFTALEEAIIPYSSRIRYPDNWDQILRRVESTVGVVDKAEPEWAREIQRLLERRVTFEFVDTPLSEAIQFLQRISNINMILDPRAIEARGNQPVSLNFRDMSLRMALDWILRLGNLSYALKDSALFISTPENLREDVSLRIYDVRDLTDQIKDFPGPEMELQVSSSRGRAQAGLVLTTTGADLDGVTAASLAEMIQERVRPEEWSMELGTSIEERGGRLVVMQRPEVHQLIVRLLESFRDAQKLLVSVEARFLEVREGFYEEIGIDWGSKVGGETLPGTGGSAFGGTDITSSTLDPNFVTALSPGVITEPRDISIFGSGELHVVGAISNFRPNPSPERTHISDNFGESDLLSQGLNAQFRMLGDMEAQAFLHALKVRDAGSVLSSPRLTVLNTQRAHMFVAHQSAYIADYEVSSSLWNPVIRDYLQGIVFDVRPHVSADRRYITLELRPTTAELAEPVRRIQLQGYQYIEAIELLWFVSMPIELPSLQIRKVRTSVTIPDGGIILIGGMMRNIKFRSETGVPFLSNLPVIGRLFRWDITDNERSNLSILVTARLLVFDEEEQAR